MQNTVTHTGKRKRLTETCRKNTHHTQPPSPATATQTYSPCMKYIRDEKNPPNSKHNGHTLYAH